MSAMPDSKYCSHCQKDRPMTLFMGINHSRNAKKPGEMDILRTCNECRTKAAKKVHASRSGRSTCSGRSTRSGRSTTAQRSVTTEAPDVVPVRKRGRPRRNPLPVQNDGGEADESSDEPALKNKPLAKEESSSTTDEDVSQKGKGIAGTSETDTPDETPRQLRATTMRKPSAAASEVKRRRMGINLCNVNAAVKRVISESPPAGGATPSGLEEIDSSADRQTAYTISSDSDSDHDHQDTARTTQVVRRMSLRARSSRPASGTNHTHEGSEVHSPKKPAQSTLPASRDPTLKGAQVSVPTSKTCAGATFSQERSKSQVARLKRRATSPMGRTPSRFLSAAAIEHKTLASPSEASSPVENQGSPASEAAQGPYRAFSTARQLATRELLDFTSNLERLVRILDTAAKSLPVEKLVILQNEIRHDWRVDEMATFVEGYYRGATM